MTWQFYVMRLLYTSAIKTYAASLVQVYLTYEQN